MTPTQTLAAGTPVTDKYGKYGMIAPNEVATPGSSFGCIVGETGAGKSSLYREHAGALVLNFDLHSMPKANADVEPALCQVFPAVNAEGKTLDADGKPFIPSWPDYKRVLEALITAAKEGRPRPQTIVFDTFAPTVPHLKEAHAKKKGHQAFSDFPGGKPTLTAYGKVYDSYVPMIMGLRHAGYGVHVLAHLMTVHVSVSDESSITKEVIRDNIPDRIYERLFPMMEFFLGVEKRQVSENITDPTTKKIKYDQNKTTKRFLVNLSEQLSDRARCRVNLPDRIELPAVGAWQIFETAYLKAAGNP